MLSRLSPHERLRLLKFVCAFAWADLRIQPEERGFIAALVGRLGFDAEELERVSSWIAVPPPTDDIDPDEIPLSHRKLFVDVVEQVVRADGHVYERERDSVAVLREILAA